MTINLDDDFIDEVGLAGMPKDERAVFLRHLYETIELKVGTALSDGLGDHQLEEFERIIDRDQHAIAQWVESHAPNFEEDPDFLRIKSALTEASPVDVICEYAATKWLSVNRPDYKDIVREVFEGIKAEVRQNAPKLLAEHRNARP